MILEKERALYDAIMKESKELLYEDPTLSMGPEALKEFDKVIKEEFQKQLDKEVAREARGNDSHNKIMELMEKYDMKEPNFHSYYGRTPNLIKRKTNMTPKKKKRKKHGR